MNRLILHRLSSPLVDVVRDAAELIDGYHRAVRSGFDGVEIEVDQFGQGTAAPTVMKSAETLVWPWDGSSRNAVAAACRSTEVNAACADVYELFSVARVLGASRLNLSLPPVTGADSPSTFARYQSAINYAHELLLRIRFDAEAAGVAIALEANSGGCLLSPVELRELLNEINSPSVGVCLDTGRFAQPGGLDDWLGTLTHRVGAVRLASGGAMGGQVIGSVSTSGRNALTRPSVDVMDSVLRALDEIHYEGVVIACDLEAVSRWNRSSLERPSA